MPENIKNTRFPISNEKTFYVNLDKGLIKTDVMNEGGFSDCENVSYKNYPLISPFDMRVSSYSQFNYYNLTAPSSMFENDGKARLFSFGKFALLIKWGICGEDVRDGYQYSRDNKVVNRDFKKGYHYVICDCLKPLKNSIAIISSAVLYDEYEENVYNSDIEINANPCLYVHTDTNPNDMQDSDKNVIYLYEGSYYYYDEYWYTMKLNREYLFERKVYYYDAYLECWLLKSAYKDGDRDATIFSGWTSDDPSLMFGKYNKYIVIMPDAVMIELDETGLPKEDKYYDDEWLNTCMCRSNTTEVCGMKIHKLNAVITDSEGITHSFPYPEVTSTLSGTTRMFAIGNGRVYATKANTANDFSYDNAYNSSSSNAWAVSVLNEGVSDSKLCALYNYGDEKIVFSRDAAYKIYGNSNPFRLGMLFNYGTFSRKSISECNGKLYFANKEGLFCYNGISVTNISSGLDLRNINNAILTSAKGVLYAYIDYEDDKAVYTYHADNGKFMKVALPYDSYIETEDRVIKDIQDMITLNNDVYALTYASYDTRPGGTDTVNYNTFQVQVYKLTSGVYEYLDYKQKWFVETNPFSAYIPDMCRITGIEAVVKGDGKGKISAYLLKEDETPIDKNLLFEHKCQKKLTALRYAIRKSEGLYHRLHIKGEGNVVIHSIRLKLVSGGDKFESDR